MHKKIYCCINVNINDNFGILYVTNTPLTFQSFIIFDTQTYKVETFIYNWTDILKTYLLLLLLSVLYIIKGKNKKYTCIQNVVFYIENLFNVKKNAYRK